ncbi:MAG: FHA domain-containing protein [Planctomycetota bacterium]|nr:MAG: FHA domain-containing protein [Planctomycetota bacterium]
MPLTEFFVRHGAKTEEQFLEAFPGAFLLGRYRGGTPSILHVDKDPEVTTTIGADEDCDFDFDDPTLDALHAVVTYHEGFRGWTVEDRETNFGTHVDGDRISAARPVLLADRAVIKPGGGLCELQFYTSATFYKRMAKSGITRSLQQKARREEGKSD